MPFIFYFYYLLGALEKGQDQNGTNEQVNLSLNRSGGEGGCCDTGLCMPHIPFLITEPSLKWAKNSRGAGKVGRGSAHHGCSWEEGSASAASREPLSFPSSGGLQAAPTSMKEVNWEVLQSGVACLPGTRDKSGRAVAVVTARNAIWQNPRCSATELACLLLYLRSTLRPECQALGLVVLVDARRCSPVPALFKWGRRTLPAFHSALTQPSFPLPPQCEVLTSMKALHKHVEGALLPLELEGALPYCHQDWLRFRMVSETCATRGGGSGSGPGWAAPSTPS
uniref:Uncharacterized protein n=1 Tax=Varanus komodoensis TaxID=61221 RepID=A0A8D2LDD0_VARKO